MYVWTPGHIGDIFQVLAAFFDALNRPTIKKFHLNKA
jgi:hypothetical protein